MNSSQSILDKVNLIEKEFDVQQLSYKGYQIWPIIRAYLHLKELIKYAEASHKGKFFQLKKKIKSSLKFTQALFAYFLLDTKNSVFRLSRADVFFVFNSVYKVKDPLTGNWINKFSDTLLPFLKKDKVLQVEYTHTGDFYIPRYSPTHFMLPSYFVFLIKTKAKRLISKKSYELIEGYSDLAAFLKENEIELKVDERVIVERMEKVLLFKKYFLPILKKVKPRVVFTAAYYSNLGLGLVAACKEAGVKIVDVQHGQQGELHTAYSGWKNYPQKGYLLHPDYFWMWSQSNVNRINSWANDSAIKPLLGGNPWINYYLTKVFNKTTVDSGLEVLRNKAKKKDNTILVSTQNPDDFINGFLPTLISKTTEDIFWLIRVHPKQAGYLTEMKNCLHLNKEVNYEIELSTALPLFKLFEIVDYNVTFWSTVAYEAQLFGIKNIIVHPYGKKSMVKYIKEQVFAYADNEVDFLEIIDKFNFNEPKEKFLDYGDDIIKSSLDSIIQST